MTRSERAGAEGEEIDLSAMAADFDGTIRSTGGVVPTDLRSQLEAVKRRGIRLVIATGRALDDLSRLIDTSLFDALVVENGAICVVDGTETILAPESWWPRRQSFLRKFGTTGHEKVIIALRREMRDTVMMLVDDTVRVELNKESMMLMPANVSKGAGLTWVFDAMGIDPHSVMAIGDGENDVSMFRVVGLAVAVRNAVPSLIQAADYVTRADSSAGVSEALSRFFGPQKP
jgi:hydroxymethylpyrimidine pyrophosphatase-like HAD family hydrolase